MRLVPPGARGLLRPAFCCGLHGRMPRRQGKAVQSTAEVDVKRWQFWLGVAISLLFLWLALRGLRLDHVWRWWPQANYWWLVPGVAVYFLAVWARAWRWHYLLRPLEADPDPHDVPDRVPSATWATTSIRRGPGELLRAYVLRAARGGADLGFAGDHHRRACLRRRGDAIFVFLNLP